MRMVRYNDGSGMNEVSTVPVGYENVGVCALPL